jgi:hypothetical protein
MRCRRRSISVSRQTTTVKAEATVCRRRHQAISMIWYSAWYRTIIVDISIIIFCQYSYSMTQSAAICRDEGVWKSLYSFSISIREVMTREMRLHCLKWPCHCCHSFCLVTRTILKCTLNLVTWPVQCDDWNCFIIVKETMVSDKWRDSFWPTVWWRLADTGDCKLTDSI